MEELNEFMDAPIEVIAGIASTAFIAWLFCWLVL